MDLRNKFSYNSRSMDRENEGLCYKNNEIVTSKSTQFVWLFSMKPILSVNDNLDLCWMDILNQKFGK